MKFLGITQALYQGLKKKDIFSNISNHENIKWAFNQALRTEKPVHILLVGPPGGGKTRFLKAIESRFPNHCYFDLASGACGAGMVSALFDKKPTYLLIDEIEHLKKSDQAVLQSLMQDGDIIETKIKDTRSMKLSCFIFAACNDEKKLTPAILSRFQVIHMKSYTKEEFIAVTITKRC